MRRARDDAEDPQQEEDVNPRPTKDTKPGDAKPADYMDQEWSDSFSRDVALDEIWEEIAAQEYPIYEEEDTAMEGWAHETEMEQQWYWEEDWPYRELLEEYAAEMYGPPVTPEVRARVIAGRIRERCPDPTGLAIDLYSHSHVWTLGDIGLALWDQSMQSLRTVTLAQFTTVPLKDILALGRGLSQCPCLNSLTLDCVGLGDDGVRSLCKGLGSTTPLRQLSLSKTMMEGDGTSALVYWMCNPDIKIQVLNIGYNTIGRQGSEAMGFLLAHNKSLRTLNMENCVHNPKAKKVDRATRAFLYGLRKNRDLETLNVNSQLLGSRTLSARKLVKALAVHPSLTDVRMAGVDWSSDMVEPLCFILHDKWCRLKKLDLSEPHVLTPHEWLTLGAALGANKSLDALWLEKSLGNSVATQQQREFCQGLMLNTSIRHFTHGRTFNNGVLAPGSLEKWTTENSIRWHRKEACKKAAVSLIGIKRFNCPPWLRGCPRDVFMLLARAVMETRADSGWKQVSGEPSPYIVKVPYYLGGQMPYGGYGRLIYGFFGHH